MTKPLSLDDLTGPFRTSGDQLVYRNCPDCDSTGWKFYIDPETGLYYCFRCNLRGKLDVGWDTDTNNLLRRLHPQREKHVSWDDWDEVELPPNEGRLFDEDVRKLAVYYHINPFSYGIVSGAGDYAGRVIVPYYSPQGRLVYWNSRDMIGVSKRKYLTMPGRHPLYLPYFTHTLPTKRLVVVEGCFDALSVDYNTMAPVVALGGKTLPKHLKHLLLSMVTDELVIMLDGDALAHSLKLARQLEGHVNTSIVRLPYGEDPASIGPEKLRELLQ